MELPRDVINFYEWYGYAECEQDDKIFLIDRVDKEFCKKFAVSIEAYRDNDYTMCIYWGLELYYSKMRRAEIQNELDDMSIHADKCLNEFRQLSQAITDKNKCD